MSRICLKRKEMQKKLSLCHGGEFFNSENVESDGLTDVSNSPVNIKSVQEHNNNQRLFEEFKIQYDQLRIAYQTQRSTYDDLVQQKKRMEIQLMNCNPQFYQKQIKRLRVQVEKLQQENEDNKHKFIIAENSKKQLEATVKVRNEELKKTLQLLEKQKVSCVELKHNLNEKQKMFQRITGQIEKSNSVLSQNYEETSTRNQKLQINLKNKTQDFQVLQRNYDYLAKKLAETQKVMKTNKQVFDQTNFKKTQIIEELQTKLRNLTRNSKSTIQELECKLTQIKNQRKTQNILIDKNIECKNNLKQQRINQLQIVRQQQINKQLKLDLQDKCKLVKSLEQKLLQTCSQQQYKQLERKAKQTEQKLLGTIKTNQEKILKAEKQVQSLKITHFRNPAIQQGVKNEFQQLLKVQIEENAKIRKQLSVKIDQIYNLKADIDQLKCKLKVNEDDISILNKKIKSQQKNHKIESDVSTQNMKNQVDSLKRKLDMMQVKLDHKSKEIKQKESFIMNTIVGRSRQQDVPLIMAEMQRIFQTDYNTRLNAALLKIQQLQRKK